jgi:hypothetical protein
MAQAFLDKFNMETLGVTTSSKMANMAHIVMEVLGFFKFGTVDIDLLVIETLGVTTSSKMANIDHFNSEVMGQWSGF